MSELAGSTVCSSLPIAVFLSGGGRTLANLIHHQREYDLPIDIRMVMASREGIGGIQIAKDAGIETRVVSKRDCASDDAYRDAMFGPPNAVGVSHVVMAGFLKHVLIPDGFTDRVLNIHPSLLPAFGGTGMYGMNVHRAVVRRGVQVTGCTVHRVDNQYDNGPIVLQRWCRVEPDDTPEQVAAKVFELECEALPTALRLWVKQTKTKN
ncbi:MAG: phosphoribosylglycinamide formyltransferase [Planctomycetota bacterium]